MIARCKYYLLLDFDHFECGISYDPYCMGLGPRVGSNSFKGEKRDNVFIDFEFLCWTFGIEIRNFR